MDNHKPTPSTLKETKEKNEKEARERSFSQIKKQKYEPKKTQHAVTASC